MKNKTAKIIPVAVSLALSVAVFVILFISDGPDMKSVISLMALALVAQSISLLDLVGGQHDADADPE